MAPSRRAFLAACTALGTTLAAPRVRGAPSALLPPAAGRRAVVVGGGWGGLSAARHLRMLAPDIEVVLVERQGVFRSLPLSNKWLGGLIDVGRLTRDYSAAAKALGYALLRADVAAIDRERRQVVTDSGVIAYDWLVLAVGIRHDYSAWFGDDRRAIEEARNRYPCAFVSGDELAALKRKIDAFAGGELLMTLAPAPSRCPPAPYERACVIASLLRSRRIKGRLTVLDPGIAPLGFQRIFAERYRDEIGYVPHTSVRSIDPFRRIVTTDFHEYRFDDAILMPPQQAGDLAWQADLIGHDSSGRSTGWAAQHPLKLHAADDERVFLVGDLLGPVSPLFGHYPKTAHVASRLGRIAALQIAAQARGDIVAPALPDSVCFVTTSFDPPELTRIDAQYRVRGDGLIVQSVRQSRDPQPRGEDEAWAGEMLVELFPAA
jgi:NADPH-dependent 2,4-dienoyl-CoA reductase/sulfur reductase-like enzyme